MRADLRLLPSPVRGFGCQQIPKTHCRSPPTTPSLPGDRLCLLDARATPSTPRWSEIWRMSVTRRFAAPLCVESPPAKRLFSSWTSQVGAIAPASATHTASPVPSSSSELEFWPAGVSSHSSSRISIDELSDLIWMTRTRASSRGSSHEGCLVRFRGWPASAQITTWVLAVAIVFALPAGCADDKPTKVKAKTSSTTLTPSSSTSSSTTTLATDSSVVPSSTSVSVQSKATTAPAPTAAPITTTPRPKPPLRHLPHRQVPSTTRIALKLECRRRSRPSW